MNIEAAKWITPLPCRRGALTIAAKWVLLGLWSHATWTVHADQRVHVKRQTLADELGVTLAVVKDALELLAEIGWVTPSDAGGWVLSWAAPAVRAANLMSVQADTPAVRAAGAENAGGSSSQLDGGSSRHTGGSSSHIGGSSSRPSKPSNSSPPTQEDQDAHATPAPVGPTPEAMQRYREIVALEQARREAERPEVKHAWLLHMTRHETRPRLSIVGDDDRWRDKVAATIAALGWEPEHVEKILDGYQRESDEHAKAGTLADQIRAMTWPQPTHLFSRALYKPGARRQPWEAPNGTWAAWAFERWVRPSKQPAASRDERRRAREHAAEVHAFRVGMYREQSGGNT